VIGVNRPAVATDLSVKAFTFYALDVSAMTGPADSLKVIYIKEQVLVAFVWF